MTFIELFDEDALENISACLVTNPCRVILLGDNRKVLEDHRARYQDVLDHRGEKVEIFCEIVDRNSLENIIAVVSRLVETYDNCVLELTGGGDLYLTAVGIVMEKYRDKKVRARRFNLCQEVLYEFDENYKEVKSKPQIFLTVEENIKLYGGSIISSEEDGHRTHNWQMDDDFQRDIDFMWNLCKENPGSWNAQIGDLASITKAKSADAESLHIYATAGEIRHILGENKRLNRKLLKRLYEKGLFTELYFSREGFSLTYKNAQVKECLSKAGQVLEMKVYAAGLRAVDENGKPIYNSVENGVWIDWDGKQEEDMGTTNEIDVFLMRGTVPIFVSCKNGNVDSNELYKLDTVAKQFGGKYAKKVLIATQLNSNRKKKMFIQRADDMDIRLIDNLQNMTEKEIIKTISALWY